MTDDRFDRAGQDHPSPGHTPSDPDLPDELRQEADHGELDEIWGLLGEARPAPRPPEERSSVWAGIDEGIRRLPGRADGGGSGAPVRWPLLLLAAAGLAALALGVASMSIQVEAAPGEVASVELRDGSVVELNSGSTFTQPRWQLPWRAPVRGGELEGEAYFQVAQGSTPFHVETFNGRVVVTGTSFTVRAWEEEGTEVVLAAGSVRLEDLDGGQSVALEPGERSVLLPSLAGLRPPDPVSVEAATAWRGARGFGAVDRPLGAILRDLERRFDREIQVAEGVDTSDRLTLHYAAADELRAILADISTARGLSFRETSRGFELQP